MIAAITMLSKRKRIVSPQLGEGSSGLAIPDGDHDPPADDCEPDPLNDESDMLMASALSNLNLGHGPQKRHRQHLEDMPDLQAEDVHQQVQGPDAAEDVHQQAIPEHGWVDYPDAAEDVHQQAIPEHGWVDYQEHGWVDHHWHGAAGNENEYWEWNYTTNTWDFWQFHNNWWYKATWRWYIWWEPQQN
jgi:hypothetical protein